MIAETSSIDRSSLSNAIHRAEHDLISKGYDESIVFICGEGIVFLLHGSDGETCDDATIHIWGNNQGALECAIFSDCEAGWRGFNADEKRAAWTIAKTIADAFMDAYQERRS